MGNDDPQARKPAENGKLTASEESRSEDAFFAFILILAFLEGGDFSLQQVLEEIS